MEFRNSEGKKRIKDRTLKTSPEAQAKMDPLGPSRERGMQAALACRCELVELGRKRLKLLVAIGMHTSIHM